MISYSRVGAQKERGAVLITALMILLVMTILGVTAMNTNILEERMSANMRDRDTAFQAAESALRKGEAWIASQTMIPDVSNDGSSGVWDLGSADPDTTNNTSWWDEQSASWWSSKSSVNTGVDKIAGVASQPGYIVEKVPPKIPSLEAGVSVDDADIYLQVTSRGVGRSSSTVVVLQSIYKW